MFKSDRVPLRHMVDAMREAVSFADGRVREDLNEDRQLTLALVKDLEIIGEAAAQVSEATRQQLDDIPWSQIIAMRNRLVHAYFDINLDIVWQTVQKDLPPLITRLEQMDD